jgi:hypothetical protein
LLFIIIGEGTDRYCEPWLTDFKVAQTLFDFTGGFRSDRGCVVPRGNEGFREGCLWLGGSERQKLGGIDYGRE